MAAPTCVPAVVADLGHPALFLVVLAALGVVVFRGRGRSGRARVAGGLILLLVAGLAFTGTAATPAGAAVDGTSVTAAAPLELDFDVAPGTAGPVAAACPGDLSAGPVAGAALGEGVIELTMSGPGTSWADADETAVVVDLALDGGPAQAFVLYLGSRTGTYRGFTGPVAAGRHHAVLRVRDDLAHATAPTALVEQAVLRVVPPTDPSYDALAHAPVMWGRSQNATSDVPTLTYVLSRTNPDGSRRHSFTEVWSNEDGGTGIIASNLWGSYGRMTDIEGYLAVDVAADGHVTGGTISGCDYHPPVDSLTCSLHADEPFHPATAGNLFGNHPVIRVDTANNTSTDTGTTAFRFHRVPVPGPAAGESREAAMDAHPETYLVMDEEVRREQAALYSTDPRSLLAGSAPQYLILDADVSLTNAVSVAVEVQLAGDPTWWSNDYAQISAPAPPSAYPFLTGGHERSVIKLPTTWHSSAITAVRLRVNHRPDQTGSSVVVRRLQLLELTTDYTVVPRPLPVPLASIPVTSAVSALPAQPG